MADSTAPLLDAARMVLKSTGAIQSLVADRVYVAVPVQPTYPYVLVTATGQPYASDTFSGMEHRLRVQAFARENRPGTVLAIKAAAFAALNRQEGNLALADHDLVLIEQEGVNEYFPEEDGRTFQSVIEFKVLVN